MSSIKLKSRPPVVFLLELQNVRYFFLNFLKNLWGNKRIRYVPVKKTVCNIQLQSKISPHIITIILIWKFLGLHTLCRHFQTKIIKNTIVLQKAHMKQIYLYLTPPHLIKIFFCFYPIQFILNKHFKQKRFVKKLKDFKVYHLLKIVCYIQCIFILHFTYKTPLYC